MKYATTSALLLLCATLLFNCTNELNDNSPQPDEECSTTKRIKRKPPHKYGGWYCPDNLGGFAPVNLTDWASTPVVSGRFPTEDEARNGSSLIFVDTVKHPDARVFDFNTPRLAHYYSHNSKRNELIIVIQAFTVDQDTIVGFRYLNGGNGSARLGEIQPLDDAELLNLPDSRFITKTINVNAIQDSIWEVLTSSQYSKQLSVKTNNGWEKSPNMNFVSLGDNNLTSSYGAELFGNFYIQNDYKGHTTKVLLLDGETENTTEMKFVFGPYEGDMTYRERVVDTWIGKLKNIAEQM